VRLICAHLRSCPSQVQISLLLLALLFLLLIWFLRCLSQLTSPLSLMLLLLICTDHYPPLLLLLRLIH
jgi:hypothetical protein